MTVDHEWYALQLKSALLPAQCMSDLTLTVVSMDRIYSRPRLFKRWMALSTVNISNQRIMQLVSLILIRWIVNYPVDSTIQRLNLGQINKQSF